jgi:XTP/dITP diphosphohydrolase
MYFNIVVITAGILNKMKSIVFVTGNQRKIGEAKSSCDLFDITVEPKQVTINEIQSHDPLTIAKHKAMKAFEFVKQPLVINDAFWSIPSLNGFPGGYMKDIAYWFTAQDFISIMHNKEDRSVIITECVVYKDSKTLKVFSKNFIGQIRKIPKGKGNSIEQVAVFNGKTLAEYHDTNRFSEKPEDQVWYEFATWFIKQK